ncbi:hypothetical protein PPACK8108_LOCUS11005 [Phakopsora pachyrhizi]|uniref:Poly(A) polymerase nucleotidyltransferase domain-containing protein n=1 Tax=Phakopsora pachyrhizi TaxID=170000 RepID=A0AAV0B128_PHAPC|nr:hypothetical protein PPACK8108_LOCUS11005 [Phakopsora pachyrhizi]
MKLSSFKVDLLFAQLALPSISDTLEHQDDPILKKQDNQCVQNLGACRVTDEILKLVPDVVVFKDSHRPPMTRMSIRALPNGLEPIPLQRKAQG